MADDAIKMLSLVELLISIMWTTQAPVQNIIMDPLPLQPAIRAHFTQQHEAPVHYPCGPLSELILNKTCGKVFKRQHFAKNARNKRFKNCICQGLSPDSAQ